MVATAEILGYFTALCAQRAMNFNEARRIWLSVPDFVEQLWRKNRNPEQRAWAATARPSSGTNLHVCRGGPSDSSLTLYA